MTARRSCGQLEAHGPEPVQLSTPTLDPTWSSVDLAGEALLAPVPLPEKGSRRGVTIPVTIESIPRAR